LLVITNAQNKKGPAAKFCQQVTDRQTVSQSDRQRSAKGMMTGVSHK